MQNQKPASDGKTTVGPATYHAALEVLLGELVDRIDEELAAVHIHGGANHEIRGRVEIRVGALGRAGVANNAHIALVNKTQHTKQNTEKSEEKLQIF